MRSRPSRRRGTVQVQGLRAGRHATGPDGWWRLIVLSIRDTDRLGRSIGRALRGGEVLALFGELGAGKTALVRGIASGLGAASAAVTSPTFVLIHEYRGRLPLVHVDLYRLGSPRELDSIGLSEYLSGRTVVAVEWADRGLALLPADRLEIELRHRTVGSRTFTLRATGPESRRLLGALKAKYIGGAPVAPLRSRRTTKKTTAS